MYVYIVYIYYHIYMLLLVNVQALWIMPVSLAEDLAARSHSEAPCPQAKALIPELCGPVVTGCPVSTAARKLPDPLPLSFNGG